MAIMVLTMASTKNITLIRSGLIAAALLLLASGIINAQSFYISYSTRAVAEALQAKRSIMPDALKVLVGSDIHQQNLRVMALLALAEQEDIALRLLMLTDARILQEQALQKSPADPYGWLRLAHLRLVTQGNKQAAFAALQASLNAARYEPRLMRDQALLWRKLTAVQTTAQQAQADVLWQAALRAEKKAHY